MLDITNANTDTKKQAAIWSVIYTGAGIIAAGITLNRISPSFFSLLNWVALLIPLGILLYSTLLSISARFELEAYRHAWWVKPVALITLTANIVTVLCSLAYLYWVVFDLSMWMS